MAETIQFERNQEYTERILSRSGIKVRAANRVGRNAWTDMKYSCGDCGGKVKVRYVEEKFVRTPNPEIFGERAKPERDYRWIDQEYFCRRCGTTEKSGLSMIETFIGDLA